VRNRRTLQSALDEIPGIGPVRKRELLKAFGSIEHIKQAALDEIAGISGMNAKTAEAVYNTLKEK
jgi:excinuclease ABC subunit C